MFEAALLDRRVSKEEYSAEVPKPPLSLTRCVYRISSWTWEFRSLFCLCLSGSLRRQMVVGEGVRVDRAMQNAGEDLGFLPTPVEAEYELVQVALKMLRADPVEGSA